MFFSKRYPSKTSGNNQREEFQQEAQNPIGNGSQYQVESSYYPSYRRKMEPEEEYSHSFSLKRSGKSTQFPSIFATIRIQQLSGKESAFFPIPGSFQGNIMMKRKEQDFSHPEEKIVRPNYL
ncbi:hypothetical protein O181_077132 [Austropuccinia psidii MF-1]|uniref:Uncharacterized protein n=1 Tax=Austropuccinia psidii MF-1 TaxID=1389203 RepID=A0A9Q3IEE7_9BASI|nr:hypothetical protein [Austropuccinia psidii MF-1]